MSVPKEPPQPRILPYDAKLKTLARRLRKNPTVPEQKLWRQLRRKQMHGFSFYRQRPLDQFIVDFFCPDLMLAIELDGDSHAGRLAEDVRRQAQLEALGVRFLRFGNREVLFDFENVMRQIEGWIELHAP